MKKENKIYEPEVIILPHHEKINAEEYIQDSDNVYRKKEDVLNKKFKGSLFWTRLACLLGLTTLSFVFIYKTIKLIVTTIQATLHKFEHSPTNYQVKKILEECFNLTKILVGLAVGVINPNWGKRLLALFFSINNKKWNCSSRAFNFSA